MHSSYLLALVFAFSLSTVTSASQGIDLSKARIVVVDGKRTILAKAAEMLSDEIRKRTRVTLDIVERPDSGDVVILIGTGRELEFRSFVPEAGYAVPSQTDGYAIWTEISQTRAATICVAGYDDRGTLFAVGRLLRLLDMGRDYLELDPELKIATAPKYPLRGHQFGYRPKTNSYDGWTLSMWEQYYRDMIVFGMNAVELIPPASDDAEDSPHFPRPKLEMIQTMTEAILWYSSLAGWGVGIC